MDCRTAIRGGANPVRNRVIHLPIQPWGTGEADFVLKAHVRMVPTLRESDPRWRLPMLGMSMDSRLYTVVWTETHMTDNHVGFSIILP